MVKEGFTHDQVMDTKYKRHSWGPKTSDNNELHNKLIVPSRYLSGSVGSCHDVCKLGHGNELEIKIKAPPARKVMLRSKSERLNAPEVALSRDSCTKKSAFKRLSLPETGAEKQSPPLSASSCKSKPPVKRALSMDARNKGKNQTNRQREAKVEESKDVPTRRRSLDMIEPSSGRKPLKKQLSMTEGRSRVGMREGKDDSHFTKYMIPRPKQSVERKAKEKKAESCQTREKGSSTWKMKLKKATATVLANGNISSPKKLIFRRPESTCENQTNEANDGRIIYKKVETERKEPHENGAKLGEVVVLRHYEEKKEDNNVIKEITTIEPSKCRKNMVKALVGAFEALISLGDSKSLVEASAS